MEQKRPVSPEDYLEAKWWIDIHPHAIGATSLLAILGWLASTVAIAKVTIVLCWIIGIASTIIDVVVANDVLLAWKKGEGRWYRRTLEGEMVWKEDREGW